MLDKYIEFDHPLITKVAIQTWSDGDITIYLHCKNGDGQKLFDTLPNKINCIGKIVLSNCAVFINLTK